MQQALWIPGPLPGTNDVIAAAKGYKGRGIGYAALKAKWTNAIILLAKSERLHPMAHAHVSLRFYERDRRRDPDNVIGGGIKSVLDGLVAAGVLPDDGWTEVDGLQVSWAVDAARPGVEVLLSGPAVNVTVAE